ncbi:hypothetical protein [Escherichia coli]|uniref:hypothetical protein n=1 Tax=Escherichia coli TaxID=562 RepID=UPI00312C8E94
MAQKSLLQYYSIILRLEGGDSTPKKVGPERKFKLRPRYLANDLLKEELVNEEYYSKDVELLDNKAIKPDGSESLGKVMTALTGVKPARFTGIKL